MAVSNLQYHKADKTLNQIGDNFFSHNLDRIVSTDRAPPSSELVMCISYSNTKHISTYFVRLPFSIINMILRAHKTTKIRMVWNAVDERTPCMYST